MFWVPHLWRCSRLGWNQVVWATWSSEMCSCQWQRAGTRRSLMSLATQTILWFCELTLDVQTIQIQVLCPYTLEATITTASYDLSSTAWTTFTDSFSCPFLSCPIPAYISVPKLPHCLLCVHCSLHLMTKTCCFLFVWTCSNQGSSKRAVTDECRAAHQTTLGRRLSYRNLEWQNKQTANQTVLSRGKWEGRCNRGKGRLLRERLESCLQIDRLWLLKISL